MFRLSLCNILSDIFGMLDIDFGKKYGFKLDNKELKQKCRSFDRTLDLMFIMTYLLVFISSVVYIFNNNTTYIVSDASFIDYIDLIFTFLFNILAIILVAGWSWSLSCIISIIPAYILSVTKGRTLEIELKEYANIKKIIKE